MYNRSEGQTPAPARPVTLDVALTPAPLEAGDIAGLGTRFVVVDVVRATTTLSVVFEHGARRVYATRDIASARQFRAEHAPTAKLAGERGGLPPEGFDFGNSPAEMTAERCAGLELVFATTNGTRALAACARVDGARIYAGAFRNGQAVAAVCLGEAPARGGAVLPTSADNSPAPQPDVSERPSEADVGGAPADVVVVCSGRGDRPAFDDTLCAGFLVAAMVAEAERQGRAVRLAEGARIALATWRSFEQVETGDSAEAALRATLAETDAGQAVLRVGLSADLAWCARRNVTQLVPGVVSISREPLALALAAHLPEAWLGNAHPDPVAGR